MRDYCRACTMIKAGVKFRIAPKHTCGKYGKLHTMKMPKVDPNDWIELIIQRGGIYEGDKLTRVKLQSQEIQGMKIPQGFELLVPASGCLGVSNGNSSRPHLYVKGWKINEVLRTLYIDKLRNG